MKDSDNLRPIKSYVVRGGRLTIGQQKAIDSLWSKFGLERNSGIISAEQVFENDNPLIFEIGFGMGDSLAEMAQANPSKNFIGVDVHPPGVGNLLRKLDELNVENVRVYQDDANLVLSECIVDESIQKVQIFFPDPWHKKRHHKRRLIQAKFIESLLPKIAQGGLIHLATDWQNYAEQMMEVLSQNELLENSFGSGKYADDYERPVTKFQRRGERLGHGVWDLIFAKK